MQGVYSKIAKPVAFLLFVMGILVSVDFFLPKETVYSKVENLIVDDSFHPKYSTKPSYSLTIDGTTVAIPRGYYGQLSVNDRLILIRTKLFNKPYRLESTNSDIGLIYFYDAPFNYFPFFPVIFLLPLLFMQVKSEEIIWMILRPLSLLVGIVGLLMTII